MSRHGNNKREGNLKELIALALAGAMGTLSRYALSGWSYRLLGQRFAYGTLVVNVLGCLALGMVMHIGLNSEIIPRFWRAPIAIGFFGAFTTFSTFGYETMGYVEDGAWSLAFLNIAANLVLCLAAVAIGLAAGRALLGGT